jgi:hypothetical protein
LQKDADGAIKKMVTAPSFCCVKHFGSLLDDVDFSALETDCSVRGGEQCIVPAHSDVEAGEEFRSALPDDNRAAPHRLAGKQLYTPELRILFYVP